MAALSDFGVNQVGSWRELKTGFGWNKSTMTKEKLRFFARAIGQAEETQDFGRV